MYELQTKLSQICADIQSQVDYPCTYQYADSIKSKDEIIAMISLHTPEEKVTFSTRVKKDLSNIYTVKHDLYQRLHTFLKKSDVEPENELLCLLL